MLWIDTREPEQMKRLANEAVDGDSQLLTLECADYLINDQDGCSLGVERKTWGDLSGSLTDGRLFRQTAAMVERYDHSILLIEGTLFISRAGTTIKRMRDGKIVPAAGGRLVLGGRESNYTHGFVQMTLFSLQRHLGVALLQTGGHAETADLLRVLHQRAQRGCLNDDTRAKATRSTKPRHTARANEGSPRGGVANGEPH